MAREYSDETKGAVMAALLTGQSVSSVAREYNIPKGTVAYWRATVQQIPTQKADPGQIGALLLDYVHAALDTLTKQMHVFSDEAWLKRQPASEVAVLHGVIADKTIRLLEGLADSAESQDDDMDATARTPDGRLPQ